MFMVNIDVNSGDWQKRNKFMYYSPQKRTSYCVECDFTTTSPRISRIHADEHNLSLPYSRKKPKVEIEKPIPQNASTQNIAEKETEPLNSQTSNFQSHSPPANMIRGYHYTPRRSREEVLEELKKEKRQRAEVEISHMRWLERPEEEIEEAKVRLGLKTRQEYLKEKEAVKYRKQVDDLFLIKVSEISDYSKQLDLLMQYSILRQM